MMVERGEIERIDLGARGAIERDVHAVAHARRLLVVWQLYPEFRPARAFAIADCDERAGDVHRHDRLVADRAEHGIVKALRLLHVLDADGDVPDRHYFKFALKKSIVRWNARSQDA